MKKLFNTFYATVRTLSLCAEDAASPVAQSEIFNETWMLRLVLALIHDYDGDFKCTNDMDGSKRRALEQIRETVQRRWISEGGLEPAFKNEGTTWTDAILGDVEIKPGKKRGVDIADDKKPPVGVVIVEAKLGSELADGVTNSKTYNQVARNIACLSKLLVSCQANDDLCNKSAFVVLAPKSLKATEYIKSALDVIKNEARDCNLDLEKLVAMSGLIAQNSVAISWQEVIDSIQPKCDEISWFYSKAKEVMKIV